ncbi:hypothetical protein PR202_ga31447 [Eleusine coracana subsp. coracana]|uniref:non-specific serine/threonine protein kinase n=1 Tax=Eleusine coracana subsp. coracana TaxID=191504 RepID=A0AAV5DRI5_ELECO|nr:hypothetical protein PR202_ga31447 [Eleusine coracana subsp. coracana]
MLRRQFSGQVIWSANPDNLVSNDAILNFTREGDLVLQDSDERTVWSAATKSKSVVGMSLDASGNLVLFNQKNSSVWQSFDHPTDTLVMGQSLCRGMNLSAKPSNTKWPSAKVYLSADYNGLRYSFAPTAYSQLFQASTTSTSRPSICYAFVNGSLGFPDTIFSLPSTTSRQFMRLESDGHLRLYDMQGQNLARILFDVLSTVMKFCDYPLACGDYGVCSNGQCSCPSLNNFRFQNERLPGAGCIPLSSTSCDHTHDHKLIPLNNVSYFSYSLFLSLAISGSSEAVCMKSCSMDCSCKVVLFQNYGPGGDGGYCLMLSEQNLILFADDSTGRFSSLLKIQDNSSGKRREKARTGQLSDLVDRSSSDMQLHMEEVMQTMKLAMWCLQVDSSKRPLMSTVAKVLEGVTSLEATPDCTFVPTFSASNTEMVDSGSIYRHSESRLSEPR